jgi:hypothetical protein
VKSNTKVGSYESSAALLCCDFGISDNNAYCAGLGGRIIDVDFKEGK